MSAQKNTYQLKAGLAQMLKGGVIMDVTNVEQAQIAERAGACAVMALETIPADMTASGKVCRMSDPHMIQEIQKAVSIPVMAKCRIGHFVEAQILQACGIDYIDESEVLTPVDFANYIQKNEFDVPFVNGCKDLGEALRRIEEGSAFIRIKGAAGTGNLTSAVTHIRSVNAQIEKAMACKTEEEIAAYAAEIRAPIHRLKEVIANNGRLPVTFFSAGGIASPADAALCMQLGCDGVFVGSGIFKSQNPEKLAKAIVTATTHFKDPKALLECSRDLGELMFGVDKSKLA